jgi:hypothetical protein
MKKKPDELANIIICSLGCNKGLLDTKSIKPCVCNCQRNGRSAGAATNRITDWGAENILQGAEFHSLINYGRIIMMFVVAPVMVIAKN